MASIKTFVRIKYSALSPLKIDYVLHHLRKLFGGNIVKKSILKVFTICSLITLTFFKCIDTLNQSFFHFIQESGLACLSHSNAEECPVVISEIDIK